MINTVIKLSDELIPFKIKVIHNNELYTIKKCEHKLPKLGQCFDGKVNGCVKCNGGIFEYLCKLIHAREGHIMRYEGTTSKNFRFTIQCYSNHGEFTLSYESIKRGAWCPKCKNGNNNSNHIYIHDHIHQIYNDLLDIKSCNNKKHSKDIIIIDNKFMGCAKCNDVTDIMNSIISYKNITLSSWDNNKSESDLFIK